MFSSCVERGGGEAGSDPGWAGRARAQPAPTLSRFLPGTWNPAVTTLSLSLGGGAAGQAEPIFSRGV